MHLLQTRLAKAYYMLAVPMMMAVSTSGDSW